MRSRSAIRSGRDQSRDQEDPKAGQAPTPPWLLNAARAAESKKAVEIRILDLREVTSFTDYFVVCSGTNARQIQAISDEIEVQLKQQGKTPLGLEGYEHAEWVLVDYGDFLVHIFSPAARQYYDLERLWRHAKEVPFPSS